MNVEKLIKEMDEREREREREREKEIEWGREKLLCP